jgi:hypothetical protein
MAWRCTTSKTSMTIMDRRGFASSSRAPKERGEAFDPLHIVMLGLCREPAEKRKDGHLFSRGAYIFRSSTLIDWSTPLSDSSTKSSCD